MKIALLGSSQLALSVAWGVCQSELAQQIVLFVDTQPGSKQGHRGSRNSRPIADGIEDITLATAMSASDTGISLTNSVEALSDSDVVVLLACDLIFWFPLSTSTENDKPCNGASDCAKGSGAYAKC